MKQINLQNASKFLSVKEMKLISGGGNPKPGYCCTGDRENECNPIYVCESKSDCSKWGDSAYCLFGDKLVLLTFCLIRE